MRKALSLPSWLQAFCSLSPGGQEEKGRLEDGAHKAAAVLDISKNPQMLANCTKFLTAHFNQAGQQQWGHGLTQVSHSTTAGRWKFTLQSPGKELQKELLQITATGLTHGKRSFSFAIPESQPSLPAKDLYTLPPKLQEAIKDWGRMPEPKRRTLYLTGYGKFDVDATLCKWHERKMADGSWSLPGPAELSAEGYCAKWLPNIDVFAAAAFVECLKPAFSKQEMFLVTEPGLRVRGLQSSQHVLSYVYRWRKKFDSSLAARLDELLDIDFRVKEEQLLPPAAQLRRVEARRELEQVPFQKFEWLCPGASAKGPKELQKVMIEGVEYRMLLLTDSHQLWQAGKTLKNCVGNKRYRQMASTGGSMFVVLSLSPDVSECRAVGHFRSGQWREIREANNQLARPCFQQAFEEIKPSLRRIHDEILERWHRILDQHGISFEEFRDLLPDARALLTSEDSLFAQKLLQKRPDWFRPQNYLGFKFQDFKVELKALLAIDGTWPPVPPGLHGRVVARAQPGLPPPPIA